MIVSSSDILRLLSGDPVIRASAQVKIVDARPPLEVGDKVSIYISRFPTESELTVTWNIWIVDVNNEPIDIITGQLRKLLPGFSIAEDGMIIRASVTELKSNRTEVKPKEQSQEDNSALKYFQDKFEELKQSIEDRMLLVGPGRTGKAGPKGKDGAPGKKGDPGKDGKDLLATEAKLDDIKDVFTANAQRGQFLMFDGASWVARFVPQIIKSGGGGGGGGEGGGIEEAPMDGQYYVRQSGQWVLLSDVLGSIDAGNFTTGVAETYHPNQLDGGDFSP